MRKTTQILSAIALAVMLVPAAASAHGNDGDHGQHRGWFKNAWKKHHEEKSITRAGSVTAVSATGFTMKADDNTVYTVTTANAKLTKPFNVTIVLADIKVGDEARVKGTLDTLTIAAKSVVITPKDTHVAKTKGTVTAVNGNTITVQANNSGVPQTVTVKTDANTSVTKNDGTAGTAANVTVGSTVKVKGLWDEIVNVLNALKIKIK